MRSVGRLLTLVHRIVLSNWRGLEFPYRITFAVTSRCQARCSMCGIWKHEPVDELTVDEIKEIFTNADRFSWINLTGGELFQRPDIADVIRAIVTPSRELYLLNFPTNGFQTEEIVATVEKILAEMPVPRLLVSVSLDGPQELHDRIRGLPGSWQRAVETFRRLRNLRSRRFDVYFGYTLQSRNLDAFDATLASCREVLGRLDADEMHLNVAHVSDLYYGNDSFTGVPEAGAACGVLDHIMAEQPFSLPTPVRFVEQRYRRLVRSYLETGRTPVPCQAGLSSCFVGPSGIVYPCSVFGTPLGSLRDNGYDLSGIWSAAERGDVRHQIAQGSCPHCWTPCEAYQSLLANILPLRRGPQ